MSIIHDIGILLDIQDTNISFEENCVKDGELKGIAVKFVHAKLTYNASHCAHCGIENIDYMIYKNGTQVSRITLPITGIKPTYLCLKKQRFKCKSCDQTFTAATPIVKRNCFISENSRAQIVIKTVEAQSLTSIAKDCSVSPHTVQRVIDEQAKMFKPHYKDLPKHLSFDEFKYAKGKMAFEYINVETGDILDILEHRNARTIKEHFFGNYTASQLKQVETVTIDMNAGYVNVIKEVFPNAEIIIDRFHLVQLISRSMNKCRVQIMNTFNTSNNEDKKKYRRLKRYWKLLLKKEFELSFTKYNYYAMFGQRSEKGIVLEMLQYSEDLMSNYAFYQKLLRAMSEQDFNALKNILEHVNTTSISNYMKTSVKSLKKHLPYIEMSFSYPYNNGRIEGINNKIKVLNRVAYGYRSFTNFKNRIMLHFKLRAIKAAERTTKTHPEVA